VKRYESDFHKSFLALFCLFDAMEKEGKNTAFKREFAIL